MNIEMTSLFDRAVKVTIDLSVCRPVDWKHTDIQVLSQFFHLQTNTVNMSHYSWWFGVVGSDVGQINEAGPGQYWDGWTIYLSLTNHPGQLSLANPPCETSHSLTSPVLYSRTFNSTIKDQVLAHSLPSAGPGADPEVQAVNPQVTF